MCPLSATMQFFVILVTLLLLCHHVVAQLRDLKLSIDLPESDILLHMGKTTYIDCKLDPLPNGTDDTIYMLVSSQDENVAKPEKKEILIKNGSGPLLDCTFGLYGNFLGRTKVTVLVNDTGTTKMYDTQDRNVRVERDNRVLNTVFTSSVATLVSIIYINFGCAVNWGEMRKTLRRPTTGPAFRVIIGLIIGLCGQFLIMPLLSFGLARLLFPNNPTLQLGLFFTGVSPGGGASNIWTVILSGNIDLSITMTSVSTIMAFGMMPLWLFTLGGVIFKQGELPVPYEQISTYAIALIVPLFIGYLIQRYLKRVSNFLVRILKVSSVILILFIIIFAIVANLYLFQLFSWQIVVAGMGLPWIGYVSAYLLARVCNQPHKNAITIALETGIQNTGIAIFLLKFTLPQPEADLTAIMPVSVAIMTPVPLSILLLCIKIRERFWLQPEKLDLLETKKLPLDVDIDNNTQVVHESNNHVRQTDISTIS